MMKLAWLCYRVEYNDNTDQDEESFETIMFSEPRSYHGYSRVVPIVYADIAE